MNKKDRAQTTHEDKSAAMGIDWMSHRSLKEAIPPAYAKFIGKQLMRTL